MRYNKMPLSVLACHWRALKKLACPACSFNALHPYEIRFLKLLVGVQCVSGASFRPFFFIDNVLFFALGDSGRIDDAGFIAGRLHAGWRNWSKFTAPVYLYSVLSFSLRLHLFNHKFRVSSFFMLTMAKVFGASYLYIRTISVSLMLCGFGIGYKRTSIGYGVIGNQFQGQLSAQLPGGCYKAEELQVEGSSFTVL